MFFYLVNRRSTIHHIISEGVYKMQTPTSIVSGEIIPESLSNSDLCQNCQQAFGEKAMRKNMDCEFLESHLKCRFRLHHPTAQSLQNAIRKRCRLCVEAWQEFITTSTKTPSQLMTFICIDERDEKYKRGGDGRRRLYTLDLWFVHAARPARVYDGKVVESLFCIEDVLHQNSPLVSGSVCSLVREYLLAEAYLIVLRVSDFLWTGQTWLSLPTRLLWTGDVFHCVTTTDVYDCPR